MTKYFDMKKILILNLIILFFTAGCTSFKIVSKVIDNENIVSFKKPLIVITYNGITESTSKRIEKKLQDYYNLTNINADFYLLEIKQDVLKLNEEKKSFIEDLIPICDKNKNDGIIFFKYDKYNYGAYGVSFTQEIFAINMDTKKVTWRAIGYTNFDGIKKYCEEITDRMILEKVILNY